ncbi:hypothetical protein [Burkholderia plantarii]|uniref:hypothetical protein n=1 Tax=Burkholderia plantarii TaxID=41899 RepID=UPI00272A9116|nr:hypothetical protein [Burkholderia plantarii]
MDHATFVAALAREGFAAPAAVRREPGTLAGLARPFGAKAPIVAGGITPRVAGATVYRPGDVFHLPSDTPHLEFRGPDGVDYPVGRKQTRRIQSSRSFRSPSQTAQAASSMPARGRRTGTRHAVRA